MNCRVKVLSALACVVLAGCSTTPEPIRGTFSPVTPETATSADTGAEVRWGGRLLAIHPGSDQTCLEILSLPLDRSARPERNQLPGPRFLACQAGFIDPATWRVDRQLTITGELHGFETRPIGEYPYEYPVVRVHAIHAWPEPLRTYDPWYDDPYYHPGRRYGPYWHPWSMPPPHHF